MKGSVYRAENGSWSYRFDLDADPLTGRRRFATKRGYRTQKEAADGMRDAMAAHRAGRRVRPSRRTVAEYLEEWHAAIRPGVRATTWVNYRDYMDAYVLPIIGGTRLDELSPVRLNLLYSHLLTKGRVRGAGGLAPKTVQNVHRMLHRALRDAVKWDYLPRNAAEDAEPPRARRAKPTIWTPTQLRRFITHVQADRFYALWLLVATTGLRRGELAGLSAPDVDLETSRISPTTTRVVVDGRAVESDPKTPSGERVLAMDRQTRDALTDYIANWERERALLGQTSQLLFVWPDGRPIHPDTITALFHKHVAAAGLPKIRLHDVRHSYATAALKAGIPAKVVSERLGHSTVAFTLQVYSHVIPGMDEQAANAVAALILGEHGTDSQTHAPESAPDGSSARAESKLTWAKAQASDGSGGGI